MNIKLDKLITPKESFDDENDSIKYGLSQIYLYKNTYEISIVKEINIKNKETNISLFGLFDGHNGPEVSKYLSLHLCQFLSENTNFINGNYNKALEETFINLDYSFRALEVQLELSKYNPKKDENSTFDKKDEFFENFLNLFNPRNLEEVNIAEFCGSCGIVILITEKTIFIANAGNSKCIPVNNKNEIMFDKINREHNIKDKYEIERLSKIFGNINKDKFINDFPLNITRGFGDLQYKDNKIINIEDQYISIKPDIIEIPIEELNFLIIGNFGCFNEDNALLSLDKYFLDKYKEIKEEKKISQIIENFFNEKSEEISANKSKDINVNNMASIIIEFKHEKNLNNIILNSEKEDKNDTKDNLNINKIKSTEDENL